MFVNMFSPLCAHAMRMLLLLCYFLLKKKYWDTNVFLRLISLRCVVVVRRCCLSFRVYCVCVLISSSIVEVDDSGHTPFVVILPRLPVDGNHTLEKEREKDARCKMRDASDEIICQRNVHAKLHSKKQKKQTHRVPQKINSNKDKVQQKH